MRIFVHILLFFCLLGFNLNTNLYAQTDIKIKIKGAEEKSMILAYHFGEQKYVQDTIQINKQGIARIKTKESVKPGIYLAVFPHLGQQYFEFVIAENSFYLETDTSSMGENMIVKGSKENKLFIEDMHMVSDISKKSEALYRVYRAYDSIPKLNKQQTRQKEQISEDIKVLQQKLKDQRIRIIKQNPTSFYASLLKAMKDVDVPDAPTKMTEKEANLYKYQYYKKHYFDNIDITDERLLRTPVFQPKFNNYFDKVVVQSPDSVVVEVNEYLSKARENEEMFKYALVTLINKYAKSNIMGMDAVYVYLVDNYYAKGASTWTDSTKLKEILEQAAALKPLLIGQKAPDLNLADTTLKKYYRLSNVEAKYTLLMFWDPDCSHCKKQIPKIHKLFNAIKNKYDIKAYSVSTVNFEDINLWKAFINEHNLDDWIHVGDPYYRSKPNMRIQYDIHTTPHIYLLDENKKIVGKKLGADNLEGLIKYLEENKEKK